MTLNKNTIAHLTVTAPSAYPYIQFLMQRCWNFKPLPIFTRFILLRHFFNDRLRNKSATHCPNKNTRSLDSYRPLWRYPLLPIPNGKMLEFQTIATFQQILAFTRFLHWSPLEKVCNRLPNKNTRWLDSYCVPTMTPKSNGKMPESQTNAVFQLIHIFCDHPLSEEIT